MAARMNEGPTFFMFFISEINSIDMKISEAFMQCVGQAIPEKALLRDRHNNIWKTKVAKVGKHWYFVDGWDKFVGDNSLTTGDLLVFEYFSDGLFNVKLYGLSGTEKYMLDDHVENNNVVSVDDHDDEDYTPTRDGRNEHNEVVHEQINNDGAGVGGNGLTCLYPKCYGMEIFEAGLAQRPTNPYFVTKIMLKRLSNLFIPMDVIKDYNLNLRNELTLVDPSGREFQTKCRQWKNGRWVLSGGWINLCRINLVSPQDSCICEFVQRQGDQRQFLHISFVRANA